MNVVVPLAGRGSRLANRGFDKPKPLIDVLGRPIIAWALHSLRNIEVHKVIFIGLEEHEDEWSISDTLASLSEWPHEIVLLNEVTEGQLCTVIAGRHLFDADEDLLIASSDTLVVSELGERIARRRRDCRGIISVADMPGDRWSFAAVDDDGRVVQVAEKRRISPHASTGLYHFSSGSQFLRYADRAIAEQRKVRGEYYVIPVYSMYLEDGLRIEIAGADAMWDLGTPEAISRFEREWSGRETTDV